MKKGFTLVETLFVVAIIVILTLIVYANVNEARKRARDVVRIRDAQLLAKTIDAYYIENKTLPAAPNISRNASSLNISEWDTFLRSLGTIDSILLDPKNGTSLEGVTPSPVYDNNTNILAPLRKHNYYYVTYIYSLFGGVAASAPALYPAIYVPLERDPGRICDADEDPVEGRCTPYCNSISLYGPLDATNCTDTTRGCVPSPAFSTLIGGGRAFVCIQVGPSAL